MLLRRAHRTLLPPNPLPLRADRGGSGSSSRSYTTNAAFSRESHDTSYAHAQYGLGASFALFSSDPELCNTACLRTENCLGWSYTDPNCPEVSQSSGLIPAGGPNATCYLLREYRRGYTYGSSCRRVSGWMVGWPNDLQPRPA